MSDTVTINVNGSDYKVPDGMNLVDALKQYVHEDVPVFCYHPKLGHDGNCRMCLVKLGSPRPNRETGEIEMAWFPTLQTACTQTTREGLAVVSDEPIVEDGRREILEFLLSSHPLDCPICDKGGECPLQNLTMKHGPTTSRMYWQEKMHLGKHVPLGDLIYLDQERCIHCARCIRFDHILSEDNTLGFDYRGRKQQIITVSEPGFDSVFSGNTTDICPVGALTTSDFRFNARPWEMVQVGSVCTHCPVGCNVTFDTRTDREAGGRTTIRRVMPRQNEAVNEVWMCDKGRFAHHYMEHPDRLTMPLIRNKSGQLVETTWEEALTRIADEIQLSGADIAAIAGGGLSNEDYYMLQGLIRDRGSNNLAINPTVGAGGEFAAQVGVGTGTNLLDMGEGDAILIIASDLHEEAPVWWLRVKAAAQRGASLIVVNGRETRLDEYATHSVHYAYGEEVSTLNEILTSDAGKAFKDAENAIILVGGEGLGADTAHDLAQSAANLLIETGHTGKANNGLVIVWGSANGQGASDMGFRPDYTPGYSAVDAPGMDYDVIFGALNDNEIKLLYIMGADPIFDDAAAEQAIRNSNATIIVQDMFFTATAEIADVVLPTQSAAEREGSYTNGERRVQRTFPAIEPIGESKTDWQIAALLSEKLGGNAPPVVASLVMAEIARTVEGYAEVSYPSMAKVTQQWPDVGGEDLYYGGTAFQNHHGLGVQYPSAAESEGASLSTVSVKASQAVKAGKGEFVAVPVKTLYDGGLVDKSDLLISHRPAPIAILNPEDAAVLGIETGNGLIITVEGRDIEVTAKTDNRVPVSVILIPRSLQAQGAPRAASAAQVSKLERINA